MSDDKLKVKIEARVKYRDTLAKEIQGQIDKLAKKINELEQHDLESYHLLNKPDCLYGDSPVGRAFLYEWIKQYMIKRDMDFVGYFLDGKIYIKDLTDRCTEASKWMLRFTKDPEVEKTGINAILEEQ